MREAFERKLVVAVEPARVWAALIDFRQVASWISIVAEAEEVVPLQSYSAVLADRIGPFKLRADLEVTLSDVRPGVSLVARAAGEDRQVASRIAVEAILAIAPAGGGTEVSVSGHYEVLGRVASLGAGSIRKKADRVLEDFFGQAAASLGT